MKLTSNTGVLFRYDTDGSFHRVIDKLIIPNGISWSLDDKTMYFTDSGTQSIYAYDYDAATGNISNKRVFFRVEEEGCAPDGHVMDVEGNMWVAIWGGWKVVRINPEGKVTAEIKVPTRCPTVSPQGCCCFVISLILNLAVRYHRRRGYLHHQRSRPTS